MPWYNLIELKSMSYICGYCSFLVANDKGFYT